MHARTIVAWLAGIWVAAGIEAAVGGGMPGPLMLIAVSAGLWGGATAGVWIGAVAGFCSAVLAGRDIMVFVLVSMAAGALASIVPRWCSRQHLLIAVCTAGVISLGCCFALSLYYHLNIVESTMFALRRSGANCLWMIPIYGIVLVMSRWSARTRMNRDSEYHY